MTGVYKTLAFILGFSCFIVQLVLIRDFMSIFMGNELVIGIMLALWMLLTASGALLGRKLYKRGKIKTSIFSLLFLYALFPIAGIFLSVLLRTMLYAPGVMVPLQGVLLISVAGLALFCLSSGAMFTLLAAALSKQTNKNSIARIYAIEALGSLAGGLIFNFILIHTMNSLGILILVMGLNLIAAAYFAISQKKALIGVMSLSFSTSMVIICIHTDFDGLITGMLYPAQEIMLNNDTPFGKLVVTKQEDQINFFMNGQAIGTSDNTITREEKVHYAMALHPEPASVLMIFGGLDGACREVLKYNIDQLDYVEPDLWALKAALEYGLMHKGRLSIHESDPRIFLQGSDELYDVIMMNAPAPNTIGHNRFYTQSFFQEVRYSLQEGGIFCFGLPSAGNYLNEETRMLYGTIYNTLKQCFDQIRIIPGNMTYFLASDQAIEGHIAELVKEKGIPTEYINEYYIDDKLLEDRAMLILKELDPAARVNTDSHPFAAHQGILRWLGMFHIPLWIVVIIPMILVIIIIFRLSPYNLGLFTTGFTASAAEFLLLIIFQSLYGFIYQMAGIIIMIFMAGLVIGAGFRFSFLGENRNTFVRMQILLGISMFLLPALMYLIPVPGLDWQAGVLVGLLSFVLAVITGIQYRLASKIREGSTGKVAATSYSADLAGSAFGIFLAGVFLFPLLGIMDTVIILAGMNIIVASVIRLRTKI